MSLTSMLKDSDVRRLFAAFGFEASRTDAEIAAPPLEHYPLTGAAFDYLARFWLERRYREVETYPWQAEYGVLKLRKWAGDYPEYDVLEAIAREWLASAKSEYAAYLDSGNPTDGLLRAALRLAKIDAVHRGGYVEGIGFEPPDHAVDDLRALWEAMPDGDLADIRPPMQLNPEFGDATELVRGADADIVADGVLIDVKTAKRPTFTREHFRQLAGYAALQRLAERPDFLEVGVYLARYGKLLTVDAGIIYEEPGFDDFLEKFRRRAEEMFGPWER